MPFTKQNRPLPRHSGGFTLIELMVGIALGVVVLGGVLAVYIPTIRSWQMTTSLAEIHDTESMLHDIFGTSIRQAGLVGCGKTRVEYGIDPNITMASTDIDNWALSSSDFLNPSFKAFPAQSDAVIEAELSSVIQNSRLTSNGSTGTRIGDVFFTLAPSTGFYRVTGGTTGSGAKSLNLVSSRVTNIEIEADKFYLINDCNNPIVVRATADSSSGVLNYSNENLNDYMHPDNTVVNEFEPAAFFLGSFSPYTGVAAVPTLYKATIISNSSTTLQLDLNPILTGVENLRIEYGVAAGGVNYITDYYTVSRYQTLVANGTLNDDLDEVYAVRLSVMIQSTSDTGNQTSLYFPDNDGQLVDCFGSTTPDLSACPEFVTSAEGRKKSHKVVQFSFIVPRIISI